MLPIRLFLAVSMLLPSALRAQIGLRPTAVLLYGEGFVDTTAFDRELPTMGFDLYVVTIHGPDARKAKDINAIITYARKTMLAGTQLFLIGWGSAANPAAQYASRHPAGVIDGLIVQNAPNFYYEVGMITHLRHLILEPKYQQHDDMLKAIDLFTEEVVLARQPVQRNIDSLKDDEDVLRFIRWVTPNYKERTLYVHPPLFVLNQLPAYQPGGPLSAPVWQKADFDNNGNTDRLVNAYFLTSDYRFCEATSLVFLSFGKDSFRLVELGPEDPFPFQAKAIDISGQPCVSIVQRPSAAGKVPLDSLPDITDTLTYAFGHFISWKKDPTVHIEDYGRVENHTLIALYDMLNNIAGTHHWKLKSP